MYLLGGLHKMVWRKFYSLGSRELKSGVHLRGRRLAIVVRKGYSVTFL